MTTINLFNVGNDNKCPCCGGKLLVTFSDGDIFDAGCICGYRIYTDQKGYTDSFHADPNPHYFMVRSEFLEDDCLILIPNFKKLDDSAIQYTKNVYRESLVKGNIDNIEERMNALTYFRGDTESGMAEILATYSKAIDDDESNSLKMFYIDGDTNIDQRHHEDFLKMRAKYLDLQSQGKKCSLMYTGISAPYALFINEYTLTADSMIVDHFAINDKAELIENPDSIPF